MEKDLNQRLKQLALTAQQHPNGDPKRQLALSQLVSAIWSSGEISHPQRGQWPAASYQELHSEALQETFLYICQKIDNYRPEHPVMAWFNNLLGYKLIEAGKKANRKKPEAGSSSNGEDHGSDVALLQKFLQDDPEGLLRKATIRGRPDVTFQRLVIARHIQDQTWEQISTATEISVQTLCSFFNRRLHKLKPYFHRHLQA